MTARTTSPPFRWRPGLLNIGVVICLMAAASFIPSDTSLSELRNSGTLRVCVPTSRPPLVTGDPAAPGFDVVLLQDLAARMGVKLAVSRNPAMGADFNPRNWKVHRGLCDVIAGGVVDNAETRGFLQTVPTGAETGWAVLSRNEAGLEPSMHAIVLPGNGLDRLALSAILRSRGVTAQVATGAGEVGERLVSGEADVGLAEMAVATRIAESLPGFSASWLDAGTLHRNSFAIGVWKGDLALKREIARNVRAMSKDGTLARMRQQYTLPPSTMTYDG